MFAMICDAQPAKSFFKCDKIGLYKLQAFHELASMACTGSQPPAASLLHERLYLQKNSDIQRLTIAPVEQTKIGAAQAGNMCSK